MLAFTVRLVPVLRGGGLFGLGNYDDGVYFSSAVGLAHGVLPYRDFLFLHPPGITLALFPFALLGRALGDASGFAVARLAWMVMGAANAVLVARVLRSRGPLPALVGGLFYGVFASSVFVEHSTLLEVPETLCLLVAIGLLTGGVAKDAGTGHGGVVTGRSVLVAGMLVGAAAGVKIWGVVVVAAVAVWCVVALGRRCGALLLTGAAVGATLVCLPFFLVASGAMWRMVVLDQLGRGGGELAAAIRLKDILGLSLIDRSPQVTPLLVIAAAVGVAAGVLAWRDRAGRLAVLVLLAVCGLLLSTPSWYVHYGALAAGPAAVVVGAASDRCRRQLGRGRLGIALLALAATVMSTYTASVLQSSFGIAFPAAQLAASVRHVNGCVTSDDPTTLIELNVLSRNLQRRCPLVVDLTGYAYDLSGPAKGRSRSKDTAWQRHALGYLQSGSLTVGTLVDSRSHFSSTTLTKIRSWPVLASAGTFAVRRPHARPIR